MKLRFRLTNAAILALFLLGGVLAVDLVFVRPNDQEFHRLVTAKKDAERRLHTALRSRQENGQILAHVGAQLENPAEWRTLYTGHDPIRMLESLREEAGLRRLDFKLRERDEEATPFQHTQYFMSVYGTFARQVRFLKLLETAVPLVVVDSFTMVSEETRDRVTLRLHVTVLSLPGEATP